MIKADIKIIKSHKKLKKLAILTAVHAVLVFIISISVIAAVNNSIVTPADESKPTDSPGNVLNISFSYDGKYYVYLYNNEIYIKDIAENTTVDKISDGVPITNFILINDRNRIIYFTLNNTFLNVKTYDIVNNIETLQKTIKVSAGSTIKHVDYSTLTNFISINVESGHGSNLIDTLYCLDIIKKVKTIKLKNTINNIVLLNDTFNLYYEDKNNNLYCYPNDISGFNNKKIQLLGCDSNDDVFIESLDNKNIIYVVKDKKIDKTINLKDSAYLEIYTDKIGVYVVYSNYILNLAGDINKKMLIDKGLKFIGIGGNRIYFRDSNDYIISKNNSI